MTATTNPSLPKTYDPAEHEPAILDRWDEARAWRAEAGGPAEEAYCILIPPPNVTAALHLGHGLNNTLQDILVRYHRMRGFNTLWMPGTDHAGIATQTVVEKRLLAQEGKRRTDFDRDAFIERVQAWKDEYEATITDQLKRIGCSCDWSRQRFTMDDMCAAAVRAAFFQLFRDGLIYRGKRLVNWDPVTRTALADDEVEMEEIDGFFWYLKYPVVDDDGQDTGQFVTVATTRPETMLGDTAVAVNPHDTPRAAYAGKKVRLPIVGRIIPVIADDYVVTPDPDSDDAKARYASGFLKVTPAHDPNDWEIGQRHGLDAVNVMAPDASISDAHGWDDAGDECRPFIGLSREDARAAIVKWFEDHDLLADTRPYTHSVGHSYRSHAPIEPYLSDQWYVKVTDDAMAGEAQRALADEQFEGERPARQDGPAAKDGDGAMRFFPSRYAKTFQMWHENLRDWCISRQLWWGHQIPVWSKQADASAGEALDVKMIEWWERIVKENGDRVAAHIAPDHIHLCFAADADDLVKQAESEGFTRDPDVLDTWFSSGLWPLSTMGWPNPEAFPESKGLLETFNPTNVLCTARDIITLWVSRMTMFNRHFDGDVPFGDVYIHPMIQDGHGQRMSKSLGNGVNPLDIVSTHGADAMRFALCKMATSTQDCRLPVDMVCPKCGHAFTPKEIEAPIGKKSYVVAAAEQTCPSCRSGLISGYGAATGAATPTDETPLAMNSSQKFDEGRNFANKLWNAARFALTHLTREDAAAANPEQSLDDLALVDRWIITRLHRTLHTIEDATASYQFNVYAEALYDFVWRDFCDWYLEAIKPTVRDSAAQQQTLRTVLDAILRLMHPVCPFVTETLWPAVVATGPAGVDGVRLVPHDLLMSAPWPDIRCNVDDADALATFEALQGLTSAIRQLRAERQTPPKRKVTLFAPAELASRISAASPVVETLAGLSTVHPYADAPDDAAPLVFDGTALAVGDLVDEADQAAEIERLQKQIDQLGKQRQQLEGRLGNPGYVERAPAQLVQQTRDELSRVEQEIAAAEKTLAILQKDA